jgi:hypothetical protein
MAALLLGYAAPGELEALRGEPWFDAECGDLLVAVSALQEAGRPVRRLELGKVYLAMGFGIVEAAERVRAAHVPWGIRWRVPDDAEAWQHIAEGWRRQLADKRVQWAADRLKALAAERRASG